MSSFPDDKEEIRRKVIGLGEDSLSKSYYPQLQQYVLELKKQQKELKLKTIELEDTIATMHKTQKLLEQNEHKLSVLFENAHDAIFILDKNHQVVDVNEKGVQLLKHNNKQDLLGAIPYQYAPLLQPNGKRSVDIAHEKLLKCWEGKDQSVEWQVHTTNNTKVFCDVSLNRITIDNEHYILATVKDITDIKRLEHDISLATIRTEERERSRFAKELHDGIGPILSTINLYVQWLEETDNEEHIKVIKEKINESIVEATKSLKEVSQNLSPHVLKNYGLIEALNVFTERIHKAAKLNIHLKHNLKQRLAPDMEIMFYRVITELINNTVKHAHATTIQIEFNIKEEVIVFHYADNGKGFDLSKLKSSQANMGLNNIKNRVKSLGGKVEFESDHHGFRVQIVHVNENQMFY